MGITGVFAPELTRDAIFEALQKKRVYGTTSTKIAVDFRLDGYFMGSEITIPQSQKSAKCEITAVCTDDIEYITLVSKDKETVLDIGDAAAQIKKEYDIEIEEGYYYIRLKQKDGNVAWSSPVFVSRAEK